MNDWAFPIPTGPASICIDCGHAQTDNIPVGRRNACQTCRYTACTAALTTTWCRLVKADTACCLERHVIVCSRECLAGLLPLCRTFANLRPAPTGNSLECEV